MVKPVLSVIGALALAACSSQQIGKAANVLQTGCDSVAKACAIAPAAITVIPNNGK
jgi:hypothetical protein